MQGLFFDYPRASFCEQIVTKSQSQRGERVEQWKAGVEGGQHYKIRHWVISYQREIGNTVFIMKADFVKPSSAQTAREEGMKMISATAL